MKPIDPCINCIVRAACLNVKHNRTMVNCPQYESYRMKFKTYQREKNYPYINDEDKDWLKDGKLFDTNARLNDKTVVDNLYNKLFASSNFRNLNLYKEALDCILGNLVNFGRVNQAMSKPNEKTNKFRHAWFKQIVVDNILRVLTENNYCMYWKGYNWGHDNVECGKYLLTIKIIGQHLDTNRTKPHESILMYKRTRKKDKFGKIIQIPTKPPLTKMYKRMKNDVDFINTITCNATVGFEYDQDRFYKNGVVYQLSNLVNSGHLFKSGNRYEINKNSMYLYRSFSRNDYRCGGRFFTPIFQSLSGFIRETMTIDGQETVELDYSGHHIRMLYHKEGLNFNGECYVYTKQDTKNKHKRDLHKSIAMIAINATSRSSAVRAVQSKINKDNYDIPNFKAPSLKYINEQYEEFLNYHKPIAKYVNADIGIRLQREDSDIMNDILVNLSKRSIIGLPVHDSVIVQKKHAQILKDEMINCYYKHTNNYPIIK